MQLADKYGATVVILFNMNSNEDFNAWSNIYCSRSVNELITGVGKRGGKREVYYYEKDRYETFVKSFSKYFKR